MLDTLNNYLFADTTVQIQAMGKFEESPTLAERRKRARERMREFGRVDLLSGGKFTRNNTVLPQVQR